MAKFWLSKSIFYVKNCPNLSKNFFIEEFDFKGTPFVIDIFWKLQFFEPPFFLKWRPIFDDFYSTDHNTLKLFKGMVVGFGPKGRPGRMCNSVS